MTLTFIQLVINIFLGIFSVYLFFENRRLKNFDTERRLRIEETNLEDTRRRHRLERDDFDRRVATQIHTRGMNVTVDERSASDRQRDDRELDELSERNINEEVRIEAEVAYLTNLKNHKLFWFFRK